MSLEGKSALVTGGTGALGSVIVLRLLNEGAKVVYSHRGASDPNVIAEALRLGAFPVRADVTDEADVQQLFSSAAKTLGRIDIVVNTVGGFLPRKSLADVKLEEWNTMMDLNLKSVFLCTRAALNHMAGRPYGRVVSISAMTGLRPSAGRAPYAISKASVSLLTDIVAQELQGTGITVNAIAPSIIDTDANRKSMPAEDFSRWVKPEAIADMVCYLCSEAAADVSGTTLKASGGV